MEKFAKIPTQIAVTWHPSLENARSLAEEVAVVLKHQSLDCVEVFSLNDLLFRKNLRDGKYDLVIALGGDGMTCNFPDKLTQALRDA